MMRMVVGVKRYSSPLLRVPRVERWPSLPAGSTARKSGCSQEYWSTCRGGGTQACRERLETSRTETGSQHTEHEGCARHVPAEAHRPQAAAASSSAGGCDVQGNCHAVMQSQHEVKHQENLQAHLLGEIVISDVVGAPRICTASRFMVFMWLVHVASTC
jgi:hypothetical protein